MLDSLDAVAVRHWCALAVAGLRRHQQEINELNVFPVADGDTGTNLLSTMDSAYRAVEAPGSPDIDAGAALRRMARGALMGARGNSGVIISQVLRGTADYLTNTADGMARGRAVARALAEAVDAAYGAVAQPVEGTVLTVVSAAAAAARAADTDDLGTVVREAARAAATALAQTPEQLDVLARAGVVDAGGRGLVVLLDALVEVVTGETPPPPPVLPRPLVTPRETGSALYAYEVQYLLDATDTAVAGLRAELAALGDSLVIVGSGDGAPPTWNVHVHVNDAGAAIEVGVRAGRPHRISVSQLTETAHPAPSPAFDEQGRGLVVVSPGPGLAEIFAAEGAVVVEGGPTNNPSTAAVLAAIRSVGVGQVALLPNDSDVQAVAAAAAREAREHGILVELVPTHSPVQALAALAVRDESLRFADDVIAMAEAAGACRWAEVTRATREALTIAGRCLPGDVLALVEGEVNMIGHDLGNTCVTLLDRMLAGGGEMVTLVTGADAPADLADMLAGHLTQAWPFVEVQHYPGGQPVYPLLVGVE